MDAFTQNFIEQQPLVALMHEYIKQSSGGSPRDNTLQNELANKPRYDIGGDRYGNTLTDDMIYQKNPRTYTEDIRDKHAPVSYEYFAQPAGNAGVVQPQNVTPQVQNVLPQIPSVNPNVFPWNRVEGQRPIGRQKNVTGDGSEVWKGENVWNYLDAPGEVLNYYDALRNIAQTEQLSAEGAMEEKFGRAPTTQDPRYDANYDYYTGTPVNYNRLSGAQLTQLAKMGVDRPIVNEDDASADLMGLVNLYRRNLGLR